MLRNKKYEKWLSDWASECFENESKFKNKVKNFSMSPQSLETYWQNKDDKKEAFEGVLTSPTIQNSPGNRKPNVNYKVTKIEKVIYCLANFSYNRDYNLLPVSMIINEKGKKRFKTLLAKDRGTFNFYFSKKDDKFEISFWRDLLKKLENEEYANDDKMILIIERIKELISISSSFSMREAVPNDLWEDWYLDEEYIVVRCRFETYTAHKNEMKRINNTTNPWVEHNKIKSDKITPLPINLPNTYKVETLDNIYNEVIKHPLFQGDDFLNVPNQKVEEFEEFLPWLFTSLDYQYKNNLTEIVSILSRASDSNFNKKSLAYENTFKDNCKVNPKTKEADYQLFKDKIDFLVYISKNNEITKFTEELCKISKLIFKGLPKSKWNKNIVDLKISKWDSFLTTAHCISSILRKVHKNRAFNNERINDITTLFFKEAVKMLNDKDVTNELKSHNGGLSIRFEYFWDKVTDKVIDMKLEQLSGNFDFSLLEDIARDSVSTIFATNEQTKIYDRISSTEVELFKPFNGGNVGQKGHLIPTDELFYGNCVVQPPKDNLYNDNHPIKDIDVYIEKYLNDVKRIMGNDVDEIIFQTTKLYLQSWISQKNYKII